MMELGFPKPSVSGLKEQLLRTTLRNVRSQGHPYIELRREEGNKLIFFCTMCLVRCYGDSNLFDHLNGHTHSVRLAAAQVTLLKPNPWPFNDGVFFFHTDSEDQNKSLPASDCEQNMLLDTHHASADSLALVGPVSSAQSSHQSEDNADCDETHSNSSLDGDDGTEGILTIPGVLQKDEVTDLVVRHMGVGKISARFCDKDGVSTEIFRIWSEWLGNVDYTSEDNDVIPEHEFAIVTFSYNYNLGRKGLFDARYLLPSSSTHSESVDIGCLKGTKRKSLSDQEDPSENLRIQDNASGEESRSSIISKSKVLFSGSEDQLVDSRILSSKTMRKLQRNQERVASERTCDICRQKMLPNKDVAALMNRTTGKLVCSSRNFTGAFHLFHISCLIHWILLREVEAFEKKSVDPKAKRRCRKKVKGKSGKKQEMQICSEVFCPECQGTGITIDGDDLEKPTVSLTEVFRNKIKLHAARNAWIKTPELLENCSMGFCFPIESVEAYQENVSPLKLLHFYRADD